MTTDHEPTEVVHYVLVACRGKTPEEALAVAGTVRDAVHRLHLNEADAIIRADRHWTRYGTREPYAQAEALFKACGGLPR